MLVVSWFIDLPNFFWKNEGFVILIEQSLVLLSSSLFYNKNKNIYFVVSTVFYDIVYIYLIFKIIV